ncbi:DMT family transporter [Halorubrum rubrum]|uniref:DMT family transporter n=1 Tax=Halorubrum rubrum TaxID=1126240 RepID=A0ABD5QXV7_9EURY|nr:EamA family transporter [Halorubrum rubrum]
MTELVPLVGLTLAIAAAVLLAVQNLCIRIGTATGDTSDAVVVVMGVNLVFVAPLAAIRYYPEYGLSRVALGAFAAAGVVGLVLGRICLFAGIERIGASRTTPIVSASTLVAAVLAVGLFDETLTLPHLAGIVCIVGGVATISWVTASTDPSHDSLREVGTSLLFPVSAAMFVGIEPILVRVGLDTGTPILVGLTVMMGTAFVGYAGYRSLNERPVPSLFGNPHMRWYVGAGLASTVGLLAYFGAIASAPVVIAIPITHTAPLIVIALSVLFLPERLERITWPLVAAAAVVVVGASLVTLSG